MKQVLKICCKNSKKTQDVAIGSTLSDAFKQFNLKMPYGPVCARVNLSLIHISEPTRPRLISYAVFCLKKKKRKKKRKKKKTFFFFFFNDTATTEIYTLSVVGSVRCV